MSAWKLDHSSNNRLQGVHPDLIRVVQRAAKDGAPRFRVIEGLRTVARQRELVARGASRTMNSRHLTGHAVDLVPLDDNGNPSWDWPLYYPLAKAIKEAARKEGVPLEWGGDWRKFKDGPHWQLPWDKRPTKVPAEVAKAPPATERSISLRSVAGGALATSSGLRRFRLKSPRPRLLRSARKSISPVPARWRAVDLLARAARLSSSMRLS